MLSRVLPSWYDVDCEDALRVLSALPDGAGPAAFLAQLRTLTTQSATGRDEARATDRLE